MATRRRVLVVEFDVTDLTPDEIDGLAGEALVQAEPSDLHPFVPAEARILDEGGER